MKKILLISLIGVVLIITLIIIFPGNGNNSLKTVEVERGAISQEISESGQVKKGEKVKLSFNTSGRIEKIYIKIGEEVVKGEKLIALDSQESYIQLQKAESDVDLAKAELERLISGSTKEEIALAESEVARAETYLENIRQNLEDIKLNTKEELTQAYEDALNTLEKASLKLVNAYDVIKEIKNDYFKQSDQTSIRVVEAFEKVKEKKEEIESFLKDIGDRDYIDNALMKSIEGLQVSYEKIKLIRDECRELPYRNDVSDSDKTSLDNQKSYILSIKSDLVDARQLISSTKLSNQQELNDAQAQVYNAERELEKAQSNLEKIKADPTEEEINLYQAKLEKARSQADLLRKQFNDTALRSSLDGKVVEILKEEGETIKASETIVEILPKKPFHIEVNIYEEDISKIDINDPVEVELFAFPDQKIKGRVIEINPAEKVVDEVVYYEVKIGLENMPEKVKSGMSADIIIKANYKEDVLIIPRRAVLEKGGRNFVKLLENGETREIEIGIRGNNNELEVISGLKEGQQIIVE